MKHRMSLVMILLVVLSFVVPVAAAPIVPPTFENVGDGQRTPDYVEPPVGIASVNQASVRDLALAMGIDANDLRGESLDGSDPLGVGISDAPLSYFPKQGSSFAVLSTGLASRAPTPNNSNSLSYSLGGLSNSQGTDLVRLTLQLKVPADRNCLNVDFAYYSEEFPEFVGSSFNDTFTAELGGTNLSIKGNDVTAPLNFAYDISGNLISVNTVAGVTGNTGTTYDGATPLLTARQKVQPGQTTTLVFSIQDLGDSAYDSAVFLDNFRWTNDNTCSSGSQQKPPLILVHGFQGLGKTNLYCDPDKDFDYSNPPIVRYSSVRNNPNPTDAVKYWRAGNNGNNGDMAAWFEEKYDVWVAQLQTGAEQGTLSLVDNASCLRYQLNYVYSKNNQPITIVAHSMGGLVSRFSLFFNGVKDRVQSVYTIGSPHAGVPVGSLFLAQTSNDCASDKDQGACDMARSRMISFNALFQNLKGIQYAFIGGDANPIPDFHGDSDIDDGLVGRNSAVGWWTDGVFFPDNWTSTSPPRQFWVDEVHSSSFLGNAFNEYRGNLRSQSFYCIQYLLNGAQSSTPNICRIPSKSSAVQSSTTPSIVALYPQYSPILRGYAGVGQTITHALPIDADGKVQFTVFSDSGTLNFILVRPDGQVVDPAYAQAHPDEVAYFSQTDGADLLPNATYFITDTLAGQWQLSITGSALDEAGTDYRAFATFQSSRTFTATTDKDTYNAGDTATLSAELRNGDVGIAGASVIATIARSDNVTDTIALADQGNGVYIATYAVPDAPGYLSIDVTAMGTDNGTPFSRQMFLLPTVAPNDARITTIGDAEAQNNNGDLLYEALNVPVNVTVEQEGSYIMLADLEANGQVVAQTALDATLAPGTQELALSFSGNDIRSSHVDGPYTVKRLTLIQTELGLPAQRVDNAVTTDARTWQEFGGCYTLTLGVNPTIGGNITTDPAPNCENGTQYSVDTQVLLTAVPSDGYQFTNWIVDASGATNPITITMDGDKTVLANLVEKSWGAPAVITTTAEPPTITADGTSTSFISAKVTDAESNFVVGEPVTFTTTLGTITPSATTDASGTATAILTSTTTLGTAEILATAGDVTGTVSVAFEAGPPTNIQLTAAPSSIVADGSSTSVITATVTDAKDHPVVGETVTFTTTAGTITPLSTITNEDGQATATLTSATSTGTATVTAQAATITSTTSVAFVTNAPATLTIVATLDRIAANGTSTSTLTATAKDANGNPVEGATVAFTTTLGSVTASSVTNAEGVATATLTSAPQSGTATVTATLGDLSASTTVEFFFAERLMVPIISNDKDE